MKLGMHTDSLSSFGFEAALDLAASVGVTAVEVPLGGQSSAPHASIDELRASPAARRKLLGALDSRGMQLAALNCSAWPLHPVRHGADSELIRNTIRLAGLLGVDKIVTMSGCPGDGGTTPNWVWYPWPEEAVALLRRQWDEATPFWWDIAAHADRHGVTRIAIELHPVHLVHNVPSLLRLREAVGPVIGANLDPSHFFWQQVDPLKAAVALGPAVHHVHLKDVAVNRSEMELVGVLDDRPLRDARRRAWYFTAVGRGHGVDFWRPFIRQLKDVGYDDVVSIENNDPHLTQEAALRVAATFLLGIGPCDEGRAEP